MALDPKLSTHVMMPCRYPAESSLALRLLSNTPTARPNCTQLLAMLCTLWRGDAESEQGPRQWGQAAAAPGQWAHGERGQWGQAEAVPGQWAQAEGMQQWGQAEAPQGQWGPAVEVHIHDSTEGSGDKQGRTAGGSSENAACEQAAAEGGRSDQLGHVSALRPDGVRCVMCNKGMGSYCNVGSQTDLSLVHLSIVQECLVQQSVVQIDKAGSNVGSLASLLEQSTVQAIMQRSSADDLERFSGVQAGEAEQAKVVECAVREVQGLLARLGAVDRQALKSALLQLAIALD